MRAIVLRCTIRPVRDCTFALPELPLDPPANRSVMQTACVAEGAVMRATVLRCTIRPVRDCILPSLAVTRHSG